MNFTNANRQLDFKQEDEQGGYHGFVRRESSGYQKYYPPSQQIQLYKPKPAPFYGQTTAGDAYKQWELQAKPTVNEDMAPPPHIPFTGTTTNRSDFRRHSLGNDCLSLGVATRGGVFHKIIARSESRPCSASQIFTSCQDNQKVVRIQVYQGERVIAVENELLGQFELHGINPAPMGVPQIEVTFDINARNELAVVARDMLTGKQQQVRFVASEIQLDRDRVKELTASARKSRSKDMKERSLIEARTNAQNIIYEVQTMLRRSGAEHQLDNDIEQLKNAMETINDPMMWDTMARDLVRKGRDCNLFM